MATTEAKLNELSGTVREYIETRIEIAKLDAADTSFSAASAMVSWVALTIIVLFALMMISLGAAIGLGYLLNNFAAGFFILAGFYVLMSIGIYLKRHKWLRNPILNAMVKNMYRHE